MAREELKMDLRILPGGEPTPSFDEVYRRYLKPVYAYLAYRLDNRSAAEDLTSQVFEKAWRSLGSFNSRKSSLSTWIFTIARNCLTDYYRAQNRRPREVELPSDFDNAEAAAGDPELGSEVRLALDGLDDREREIISLKFGAALTNRRIAELLKISESNVGTILCRSLKKMKTQLEGGIKND